MSNVKKSKLAETQNLEENNEPQTLKRRPYYYGHLPYLDDYYRTSGLYNPYYSRQIPYLDNHYHSPYYSRGGYYGHQSFYGS